MSDTEKSSASPRPRIIITHQPSLAQRRWRVLGYSAGVCACLGSMLAGTLFGYVFWGSKSAQRFIKENGIRAVMDTVVHQDPMAGLKPEEQFIGRDTLNVLVLGVDYDYDDHDRIVKTANGRSDSILLARFDFTNKRIDALTIPRDSAVRIPGHDGIHKINAAHSFGGPDLTVETIRDVFKVQPDAYVVVNFEGFQKIVDALGGIDLDVEKKLDYDDNWGNLHIHLKPGYQHMNGYQAMGYVRMRHSDSDEMRSKRQHAFLEAMRIKIKTPSTFFALPKVLDRLNDSFKRGNLTEDQLISLANFARSLPRENINVETLPSFEGPSFVTINREKSSAMIQRLFFPGQSLYVDVDAPDPNYVRSMNSSYERGGRRNRRNRAGTSRTPDENTTPERPETPETPQDETPTREPSPPNDGGEGGRDRIDRGTTPDARGAG